MAASLPPVQPGDDAALPIGRWPAADRYASRASPAEAGPETCSDMTEARPAMLPPHATGVAAQAFGSSSGRYARRKVSSFSGTGEPSHIA
jgi:hypothetical protein